MNILYIAHERNMGGASKCLLDLTIGMKSRGHNIYVIVPVYKCRMQKELEREGIKVISLFFLWWQYPRYWNKVFKILFRIGYYFENISILLSHRYIVKYKIDFIHSNSSVIDFGMKLSQKYHVKHIWHFREFGDLDYQLEYFLGRETSLQRINHSDSHVIFISNRIHRYYQKWIEESISHVIYDGIDISYCQKEKQLDDQRVIFLVAGNLHRNKRQDLVIEAAHILFKKNVRDFEVWIAGQTSAMRDSKQYELELHRAAADIPQNIKFIGFISDMIALRKKIDIEIVPSSEEAFGRVTVEAMLSSSPVIGSDSGATPELISDQETGLLFKTGNAEQLAQMMEELIIHRDRIIIMGQNAYKRAKLEFGLRKNLDEIESLYYKLRG